MRGQYCGMRGMAFEFGRSLLVAEQTWRVPVR